MAISRQRTRKINFNVYRINNYTNLYVQVRGTVNKIHLDHKSSQLPNKTLPFIAKETNKLPRRLSSFVKSGT